jgi:CRP/FNR family transcriptional regulator, nitrogen oxide reductase regulator
MQHSPNEINIIRNASILKGLDEQSFQRVLESAIVKKLGDGEYYFLAEQPATHAYILLDGKVKLAQVTTDGHQVILGYLVPGRVYGIIAILKKITYPVSAQAVGNCKALVWDQATLNHLMEASPRIALNSLRLMSGQIREFQNRVKDLSTKRVEQRIARAILRLARQSGKKVEEGVLIDLPLSRQDLAEMSGTTLYTVSRVFTEWERSGLTHSQRQKVTITNPHGLVVLAEDLPQGDQQAVIDTDDLCDL